MDSFFPMLKSSLSIMIPIFFAALGGLFPALAGSLNIALEGLLLIGAFSSLAVYHFSGSITAAIFAAIISSMILCILHIITAFKLKANIFICGLAVNLFSSGICIVLSEKLFNTKGVIALNAVYGLRNWYLLSGLILLFLSWIAIYKTPFGYRLRACDKNSSSLISLGIKPHIYQIIAIMISGFFCGIGGSFLSLNLGAFVPGMSAGKGWIVLAVIFLGVRKPIGILFGALIFAIAESFSNYAQGFWNIPADFILAFPYVCTLIIMILVSIVPEKFGMRN